MTIRSECMEAAKVKTKKGESDDAFLKRLADAIDGLDDDGWNSLSEPAQTWANAAISAASKQKLMPLMPDEDGGDGADSDVGVDADAENDDNASGDYDTGEDAAEDHDPADTGEADTNEDEEEGMSTKSKTAAKGKADKKAPAKKAAPTKAKSAVDKASDKGMAKSTKTSANANTKTAAKSATTAAKTPAKAAAAKPSGTVTRGGPDGIKNRIKTMLAKSPKMTSAELIEKLQRDGEKLSTVTIAAVRSEFRHTIKVLNGLGMTKLDLG